MSTKLPSRADHVGSFLRPRSVIEAREHRAAGNIDYSELRAIEDAAIAELVKWQESLGLKAITDGFIERYFPSSVARRPTTRTAHEHGRQLALNGPYWRSRGRANSMLGSLSGLFGQQRVTLYDDETIAVPAAVRPDGKPKRWREIAPYVWEEVGGRQRLAADVVDGRIRAIAMDSFSGTSVLLPVPPLHLSAWIFPLLFGAISVLVLTLVQWPVGALVRRHYGIKPTPLSGREALAKRLARSAALVNLSFLSGWGLIVQRGTSDASAFSAALDPWLRFLQLLALLGAIGAGFTCWYAWLAWRGKQGRWSKLWSLALAAACVCIAWFAFAFKLVTISLEY